LKIICQSKITYFESHFVNHRKYLHLVNCKNTWCSNEVTENFLSNVTTS